MIDPSTETTISLTEAGQLLPRGRNGAKPGLSTLLRWILVGCKGPDGEKVKLRAGRCGGKWFTSQEALREFIEALTPCVEGVEALPPRTLKQRRRASERAARELERMGI